MPPAKTGGANPLSFGMTVECLEAIAGFTIFLGLPIARARRVKLGEADGACSMRWRSAFLVYLVVEIAQNAIGSDFASRRRPWRAGAARSRCCWSRR